MFKTAGFALVIAFVSIPALAQEQPTPSPSDQDILSSSGRKSPSKDASQVETPKADLPVIEAKDEGKTVSVKPADKEVLVEHREGASSPWTHVCAASKEKPCAFAPKGGEYRVIGVDVSPSNPFLITGPGQLSVDIGSAPLMRRGEWLTGIGSGVALVGFVLALASSAFADPAAGGIVREDKIPFLAFGTAFMIGGGGVGLYGAATYWQNHRSGVSGPIADVGAAPKGKGFILPLAFTF